VLVAIAVVAFGLAVRGPIATAVLGLILFGVLHSVFAIRYFGGRFSGLLGRRFVERLVLFVTGIVLCRLLAGLVGTPARLGEVLLGYGLLTVGAWYALEGRRRLVALGVLAPALVVSSTHPAHHLLVLGFVHLVAPLFFLWEWSQRLEPTGRRVFRAAAAAWTVGLPAVVLVGWVDRWLSADPGAARSIVGDGLSVLAASAPPGAAQTAVGLRFLTVIAFLQAMAYVVWIWFLPRHEPDATAAFEARLPWLTGARVWAAAFTGAAFFAVLFTFDFARGRMLYGALTSYASYLEVAVLLALLVSGRGRRPLGDTTTGGPALAAHQRPAHPSPIEPAPSEAARDTAA
jgi:hypothetical protein